MTRFETMADFLAEAKSYGYDYLEMANFIRPSDLPSDDTDKNTELYGLWEELCSIGGITYYIDAIVRQYEAEA